MSNEFEVSGKALDKKFECIEDKIDHLTKEVHKGFVLAEKKAEEREHKLNEKFDKLLSHIDFLIKGQKDITQELTVIAEQIRRHEDILVKK